MAVRNLEAIQRQGKGNSKRFRIMKTNVDSLITNAITCAKKKGKGIDLIMCKASDGNLYYCIWTDRRRYFSYKLIGVELMIHFIHKIILGKDKKWLEECFTKYGYYNR